MTPERTRRIREGSAIRNREVAVFLGRIAELLEAGGEQPFRVRAYREAAQSIARLGTDVADLHKAGALTSIHGVGPSIAGKIDELLRSGRSQYMDKLLATTPAGLVNLLKVPGLSPQLARAIHDRLGVGSVEELAAAAAAGRLRAVPGIGPKTEQALLASLRRREEGGRRFLLSDALPLADLLLEALASAPGVREARVVGSLRRMVETVGGVDILVSTGQPQRVLAHVEGLPFLSGAAAVEGQSISASSHDGIPVTVRCVEPAQFGTAQQYFTGSVAHNLALAALASTRGFELSAAGLRRVDGRAPRTFAAEEAVYDALGLACPPPELREDRGEIELAARGALPRLLEEADLRGDLHMHSDFSDGKASVETMVQEAVARGYNYIAITDHSYSLRVAGGMSIERVREQRRLIDTLNRKYHPFRVLAGIEVEIRGDGSLDYPDEILREFDLITASLHNARGQNGERATARTLQAVGHPLVSILNHPSGRIIGRRAPYPVDINRVIEAAGTTDTALELNASPDRLDLNDSFARLAARAGVRIALSTDAHSPSQLAFVRYGVAQARRAWLQREDVLNTLPLAGLLAWLERERRAA